MREETAKKKLERDTSDNKEVAERKKYKVNNAMLSLIVKDNVKNNRKMDQVT